MTLPIRLPLIAGQQLAQYGVERKITKSEAVKLALDDLLLQPALDGCGGAKQKGVIRPKQEAPMRS